MAGAASPTAQSAPRCAPAAPSARARAAAPASRVRVCVRWGGLPRGGVPPHEPRAHPPAHPRPPPHPAAANRPHPVQAVVPQGPEVPGRRVRPRPRLVHPQVQERQRVPRRPAGHTPVRLQEELFPGDLQVRLRGCSCTAVPRLCSTAELLGGAAAEPAAVQLSSPRRPPFPLPPRSLGTSCVVKSGAPVCVPTGALPCAGIACAPGWTCVEKSGQGTCTSPCAKKHCPRGANCLVSPTGVASCAAAARPCYYVVCTGNTTCAQGVCVVGGGAAGPAPST